MEPLIFNMCDMLQLIKNLMLYFFHWMVVQKVCSLVIAERINELWQISIFHHFLNTNQFGFGSNFKGYFCEATF